MTLRDEAWNAAMEQIVKTGKFKLADLPFKKSERHTVRRVLREQQRYSWLTRDSDNSSIWRAGPKAELMMNLSEDKLRQARE